MSEYKEVWLPVWVDPVVACAIFVVVFCIVWFLMKLLFAAMDNHAQYRHRREAAKKSTEPPFDTGASDIIYDSCKDKQ